LAGIILVLVAGGIFGFWYAQKSQKDHLQQDMLEMVESGLYGPNAPSELAYPLVVPLGSRCVRIYFAFNQTQQQISVCPLELNNEEVATLAGFDEYPFPLRTSKWQYNGLIGLEQTDFLRLFSQVRTVTEPGQE